MSGLTLLPVLCIYMHDYVVKIVKWRLKLTGSDVGCEKTDGIWRVTVPAMVSISTLAFKALLLCHGTEKCPQVSPAQ